MSGGCDDTCRWANDGVCDEPQNCDPGTDCSDCTDDATDDDQNDEYEDDDYGVGWNHLKAVHCNSHYLPGVYGTIPEALEACETLEDACSGVYDNKCDQQAIQYGSCCAGFVLCDAGYSLEVRTQTACIDRVHRARTQTA